MLNIDGLASGLDTTTIIEGLLSIQQSQIDRYTANKQELLDQQSAFKGIEARLLSLQSSLGELTRPATNAFLRKSITSSNDTAIAASVSNDAAPGVYTVRVNRLAHNHQIVSQVYDSAGAQIAKGTISVATAAGTPTDLVVDDSNNTLEGLALTINSTLKDVTASVLQQGSGYRLLLSSNKSGVSHAMTVTETASDPAEASLLPGFDLNNPVQAAEDAELQLGSGAGAIVVTSDTNVVDDLFTGITINLFKASTSEDLTLTVNSDTTTAREALTNFVDAYNSVIDYTAEQNRYDAASGAVGALFGNRTLLTVRDRLAQSITQPVPFADANRLNRLSSLGIRLDAQNKLVIQSNRLDDVLNGRVADVQLSDLQGIFGFDGESSSQFVQFIGAGSNTKPSGFELNAGVRTVEPYKVEVLQAATQGTVVGTNALASSIVIAATNNELSIDVDSRKADKITLTAGTYTPDELAAEIEQRINDSDQLPGREVRVTVANQSLQITSLNFGKASAINSIGGTASSTLGFSGSETGIGQDVVGNYYVMIDGSYVKEAANGRGRVLTGAPTSQYTADLAVRVTLTPAQIGQSFESTVSVTRGVAETLDQAIDSLMANEGEGQLQGQITTTNAEFTRRIESIDQSISRLNAQFEAQQKSLISQFTLLETQISELQNVGNILSAQLASVPRIGS